MFLAFLAQSSATDVKRYEELLRQADERARGIPPTQPTDWPAWVSFLIIGFGFLCLLSMLGVFKNKGVPPSDQQPIPPVAPIAGPGATPWGSSSGPTGISMEPGRTAQGRSRQGRYRADR